MQKSISEKALYRIVREYERNESLTKYHLYSIAKYAIRGIEKDRKKMKF